MSYILRKWLEVGKNISKKFGIPYTFNSRPRFFEKIIRGMFDRTEKKYEITPGYNINLIKIHSWGNTVVSDAAKKKLKELCLAVVRLLEIPWPYLLMAAILYAALTGMEML